MPWHCAIFVLNTSPCGFNSHAESLRPTALPLIASCEGMLPSGAVQMNFLFSSWFMASLSPSSADRGEHELKEKGVRLVCVSLPFPAILPNLICWEMRACGICRKTTAAQLPGCPWFLPAALPFSLDLTRVLFRMEIVTSQWEQLPSYSWEDWIVLVFLREFLRDGQDSTLQRPSIVLPSPEIQLLWIPRQWKEKRNV